MTELIFWTRQIWWEPSYKDFPEEKSIELLKYAYKSWVRLFDTAPIYWKWKSEELLWKALKNVRKNLKIITKFWFNFDANLNTVFDFTSYGIKKQLEESLERLQTDFIDIYLLHIPDEWNMDIDEIIETLNILKKTGKIKSYGISNTYSNLLNTFLNHKESEIDFIQDFYNIIENKTEKLIFPYINWNIQFMAYSPLFRWVLTDNSFKQLLEKDENAINRLLKHDWLSSIIKKRKILWEISKRKNISIEKLAINFLKNKKEVNYIVFWTTSKKHLDEMIRLIKHNS